MTATCNACGAPAERVANPDPSDVAAGGAPSVLIPTCGCLADFDLGDLGGL